VGAGGSKTTTGRARRLGPVPSARRARLVMPVSQRRGSSRPGEPGQPGNAFLSSNVRRHRAGRPDPQHARQAAVRRVSIVLGDRFRGLHRVTRAGTASPPYPLAPARAVWVLAAVALVVGLPAAAGAQDRLVAVVVVTGGEDGELADRVEGQTSDLDLALVVERRAPGSAAPELGEAAAIASRHGARVVIWFRRDASSWLVHIAEPSEDREFVRRVAARGDLASSATAEGVALVVRGALRALAAGGTIGVAEPLPAGADLAASVEPSRSSRRAFAAIGWRAVTSGPAVQHGVAARAGLAAGRWHGDVGTGFFPAVAIDNETATIEVERWSFTAGVGVELGADPSSDSTGWRAGFALDGGATRFARVTTSASGVLMATPPETIWSPTASARARLARRLAGPAWLELAIGAELLMRPPEFGVDSDGDFAVHTRLRLLEPFGALGLVIDFG
jgi:hypothetical protein